MREKRIFAQRSRVLVSDEVRKKYFLVYEGEFTEQIYFDAIERHKEQIGINPLIELVPVVRSYSETGWSNPKKLLDRVIQNLEECEQGIVLCETLLNWIMDYFYEQGILTTSKVQAANMWSTLCWICESKLHISLTDTINNIEESCKKIAFFFSEESDIKNIVDDVPQIIKYKAITYSEGFDKICFIIDRDQHSFISNSNNNQYEYVLNKCRERGFGFYLSNPCFEFWLLLHFNEVLEFDKQKLLDNPKVTANRRYTDYELRK